MQLFGRTVLQCRNQYDTTRAEGVVPPWPGGPDYPLNSGEIWITGPNRIDCGGALIGTVIGSIFSELIEL
jgi:hypothetical protein